LFPGASGAQLPGSVKNNAFPGFELKEKSLSGAAQSGISGAFHPGKDKARRCVLKESRIRLGAGLNISSNVNKKQTPY